MDNMVLHDSRGRAYGIGLNRWGKVAGLRRIPSHDKPADSVKSAFPYHLPVRYPENKQ